MNDVNKTLYIPLYGKSYVSKKGILLKDIKAEEIWRKEQFKLKRKSKSKWLAYYMSIRALVFDDWVKEKMSQYEDSIVIHIGCGMDSRVFRIGTNTHFWYDVDFLEVITERKKYYEETHFYKMIEGDIRNLEWLNKISKSKRAIVILEGVSMYLKNFELQNLFISLSEHFENINLLMDCYSLFAEKMSKYKNPVKEVGVNKVYGLDNPNILNSNNLNFVKENIMIPKHYISELKGIERFIFSKFYAGNIAKKLYKLYEFEK